MKPRVMSLVVFTALVGLIAAPGQLHPLLAVIALLAIAVGAGAAGALNMWYDADIDARMARTAARPIPRGHVTADEALTFGTVLAIGSVLTLGVLVNWAAGALLALTIGFYVFVYTMWLKRRTPQNIVIGGAAGAFPPMIGWAAVTGGVSLESILLFLIIFMWTPPHFWALALYRARDYERAGVPMLPVVAGAAETRRQIVLYSVLLVPLATTPALIGLGEPPMRPPPPRSGWCSWRSPPRSIACAKAAPPITPPSGCSASRSSIFSCCSRCCSPSTSRRGFWASRVSEDRNRRRWTRRNAAGAGACARSRSRLRSASWCCCSRRHDRTSRRQCVEPATLGRLIGGRR